MKRWLRNVLLFALLSCAPRVAGPAPEALRDLVLSEDDCEGAPEEFWVSHDAVRADLDVVERIIREGWAGFDVRTAEGADWKAVFAALRSGIGALPDPVAAGELSRYLADGLRAAARDNHLAFAWVDARGRRRMSSCGGHLDAWTQDGGAGEGAFLVGSPPRVEKRPLKLSATQPGPEWRRLISGARDKGELAFERDGAVLRLRTLDTGRATELKAFAAAGVELRDAKWVLLDLRGNSGGGDGPAIEFVKNLTSGPLKYGQIDLLDSDVTRQGELNVFTCEAARPDIDRESRAELERHREAARLRLPEAKLREWKTRQAAFEGVAPKPFAGKLVLLVDRRCASSCESLVTFARQVPGAVVVGENTAGTGAFGEVLDYRLPRTGLWMRAGSKRFDHLEEIAGVTPDFWIDAEDPRAIALELAAHP
jgi:hypothetical protein